jgi:AbiV family abortive infection protein
LAAIFENATRIAASVQILAREKQYRGSKILKAMSDEEAAKYLILMDAIRCPRKPEKRLSDHLNKFNHHLAKGIYADACAWRPVDLSEVRQHIESECQKYYLDGPNDIDWVFENWIIRQREEAFYVDYLEYDKTHEWISPERYEAVSSGFFFSSESPAIKLVRALHEVGVCKPKSLKVVAELWRTLPFTDQSKHDELRDYNIKTLQKLREEGQLNNGNEDAHGRIVEFWLFPL